MVCWRKCFFSEVLLSLLCLKPFSRHYKYLCCVWESCLLFKCLCCVWRKPFPVRYRYLSWHPHSYFTFIFLHLSPLTCMSWLPAHFHVSSRFSLAFICSFYRTIPDPPLFESCDHYHCRCCSEFFLQWMVFDDEMRERQTDGGVVFYSFVYGS